MFVSRRILITMEGGGGIARWSTYPAVFVSFLLIPSFSVSLRHPFLILQGCGLVLFFSFFLRFGAAYMPN